MKLNLKHNLILICLFLAVTAVPGISQEIIVDSSKLPLISFPEQSDSNDLKKQKDLLFRQFTEEADYNTKIFPDHKSYDKNGNPKNLYLTFYKVKPQKDMDFIWLASRLSPVTRETTSTLNRLPSADTDISDKILLVSTFSGLFIPEKPQSAWEQLLHKQYITDGNLEKARVFIIDGEKFYFLERMRFDSTISLFFLDTNMVSPLKSSILTSDYGYRISPISGKWKFHSGIDLAAPEGTQVFACKAGEITRTGFNTTYGNFIIIRHYNGLTSVYAHLSKILVTKGEKINGGTLIGLVGTTGASTGPHLHFELRKNGSTTNPGKLMNF